MYNYYNCYDKYDFYDIHISNIYILSALEQEYTIYNENGNKFYKGCINNDKKHGNGISYYYENGNKFYEGEFKDDKKHGLGIIYDKNVNILYNGNIEDNMILNYKIIATKIFNESLETLNKIFLDINIKSNNYIPLKKRKIF